MELPENSLGLAAGLAILAATGSSAQLAPAPPVYQPVTSNLMNMVIQPRHMKLWLAGQATNYAMVVIKTPSGDAFPDQDFGPSAE